jgi:hypothetical protein
MTGLIMPGYLIAAIVVGLVAIPHRIGFFGGFLLSLVITPLGALVVMVAIQFLAPKKNIADNDTDN